MEADPAQRAADNKGPTIVGVCTMWIVLSVIAVALRFWSRVASRKAGLWWDDWSALASLPFIIALNGFTIWWKVIGLGVHEEFQSTPLTQHLMNLYIVNQIYNTGLTFVKLSVVLFYARVLKSATGYRYALWFSGFLVIAWCIGYNCLCLFACNPIKKSWMPKIPGTCVSEHSIMLGATSTNIIIDVLLLVLPLPALWNLHMRTGRKLALTAVFMSGYCVVIVSIVRLVSVDRLGQSLEEDFSWNFVLAELMVCVETGIALLCCCLPAIYQLVKTSFSEDTTSKANSGGDSSAIRMGNLSNPLSMRSRGGWSRMSYAGNQSTTGTTVGRDRDEEKYMSRNFETEANKNKDAIFVKHEFNISEETSSHDDSTHHSSTAAGGIPHRAPKDDEESSIGTAI